MNALKFFHVLLSASFNFDFLLSFFLPNKFDEQRSFYLYLNIECECFILVLFKIIYILYTNRYLLNIHITDGIQRVKKLLRFFLISFIFLNLYRV